MSSSSFSFAVLSIKKELKETHVSEKYKMILEKKRRTAPPGLSILKTTKRYNGRQRSMVEKITKKKCMRNNNIMERSIASYNEKIY